MIHFQQSERPDFSVIIPARNEEQFLPECLKAISQATARVSGSVEVIVVLNRCTDRTEEIARAANCRIERNDEKNLAAIRNTGCRAACGKTLVTVDADSMMTPNLLQEIKKTLDSGTYIGGGVMMWPTRWSVGIMLTAACLVPIVLRHGISGGVFFLHRSTFDAIGGFDESLHTVEDIDFAKRLKKYGLKEGKRFATLFRASITTSTRKFDHFGDWYFLLRPKLFLKMLSGKDQESGNRVWYDFER